MKPYKIQKLSFCYTNLLRNIGVLMRHISMQVSLRLALKAFSTEMVSLSNRHTRGQFYNLILQLLQSLIQTTLNLNVRSHKRQKLIPDNFQTYENIQNQKVVIPLNNFIKRYWSSNVRYQHAGFPTAGSQSFFHRNGKLVKLTHQGLVL